MLEIGTMHTIILNKLFGPTVFCDLKISIDDTTMEWVIEKQCTRITDNVEDDWFEEVCRINCQESLEFYSE